MTSEHRQPLAASRILPEPSRGRHRSRSILGDDPYRHQMIGNTSWVCCRYAEDMLKICLYLNEIPQVQPWRPAYCKVGSSKNLSAPDQFVCVRVLGFIAWEMCALFHKYLQDFDQAKAPSQSVCSSCARYLYWYSGKRWQIGFEFGAKKCVAWRP